jgi:hypothetical protein
VAIAELAVTSAAAIVMQAKIILMFSPSPKLVAL